MATSRTGLTPHLEFRRKVLRRDKAAGVKHCPICLVQLDYEVTRKPNSAEPDHIIPDSLGGTNKPENGRTICRRCNQRRGNKIEDPIKRTRIKASPIW